MYLTYFEVSVFSREAVEGGRGKGEGLWMRQGRMVGLEKMAVKEVVCPERDVQGIPNPSVIHIVGTRLDWTGLDWMVTCRLA